jgi:hypothetical protein
VVERAADSQRIFWFLVAERVRALCGPPVLALLLPDNTVVLLSMLTSAPLAPLS